MIDTHCHIDDPQYADSLSTFLEDQKSCGVEAMLVPGVDKTSVKDVLGVCDRYPNYLFPALGLHPENVKEDWQDQLSILKSAVDMRMSSSQGLVAIGEIGLDYHWDTTFRDQQHEALREQMRWAKQWNLPVMIHSRDATEDTLKILREFPEVKGVMHCFSGSHEVAQQVIDMGYLLGIGGVLTFKNCKLAEHLEGIPLECLLLETDAPYMAPVPHRGKRNESKWMYYVMEHLSHVYKCSIEYINEVTTTNAKRLFVINL